MNPVTTETKKRSTVRRPETGWATARRVQGQAIRTCVRATIDGDSVQKRWGWGDEGNIVRGED